MPEATPPPPIVLPTSPQHQTVQGAPPPTVVATGGPIATTPEQIAKLQSELDIVSMNMSVLGEMLTELKPGQEDPSDYKLLNDLTQTCKYVFRLKYISLFDYDGTISVPGKCKDG